jgi:hypothetical protein
MSGNSAGQTWDPGCEVREQMIDFLQRDYPEAPPRQRNEVAATGAPGRVVDQAGQPIGPPPAEKPAEPHRQPAGGT